MHRLHLVHWKMDEAEARALEFENAGFEVQVESEQGNAILRNLRAKKPDVVVIDLSRMPSHGRDIAAGIRMGKNTRRVPILFVGGVPEKVERIRQFLPDAGYCSWNTVFENVERVIENPPRDPVIPDSILAGYSGTPLPKKLGLKVNSRISIVGAPNDFVKKLETLPEGAKIFDHLEEQSDLIIFFTLSREKLLNAVESLKRAVAEKGGIWIAWPKKSSGVVSDLTQAEVRSLGLSNGLVDYKVCAIDSTWSGLKFAIRK